MRVGVSAQELKPSPGCEEVVEVGVADVVDLVMSLMGALGSSAGGMILGLWGFTILNVAGAALTLVPLAVTVLRHPLRAAFAATDR